MKIIPPLTTMFTLLAIPAFADTEIVQIGDLFGFDGQEAFVVDVEKCAIPAADRFATQRQGTARYEERDFDSAIIGSMGEISFEVSITGQQAESDKGTIASIEFNLPNRFEEIPGVHSFFDHPEYPYAYDNTVQALTDRLRACSGDQPALTS